MDIRRLGGHAARILVKIMSAKCTVLATCVVLFLLGSQFSAAQQVSRYDVFGGYSYLRLDSKSYGFANSTNMNGGEIQGAYNLTRNFAAIADIGADFAQNQHFYSFMAGGQASLHRYHGTLFAHVLGGKARNADEIPNVASNVGRSIAAGGGYDLPFRQRYSIRVFQVDWVNTHTYGVTQNNIRASVGLVFHFGKTLK